MQQLTNAHDTSRVRILSLAIPPEEESGSTNVGEAILLADAEFSSPRHNGDARKIAVLLTDGRANTPVDPGGEPYALEQAGSAKAHDVIFYTIGLGDKVNQDFLRNLAGSNDRAFFAASRTELNQIYREISADLCERGAAVIDIIPKTQDAFIVEGID